MSMADTKQKQDERLLDDRVTRFAQKAERKLEQARKAEENGRRARKYLLGVAGRALEANDMLKLTALQLKGALIEVSGRRHDAEARRRWVELASERNVMDKRVPLGFRPPAQELEGTRFKNLKRAAAKIGLKYRELWGVFEGAALLEDAVALALDFGGSLYEVRDGREVAIDLELLETGREGLDGRGHSESDGEPME